LTWAEVARRHGYVDAKSAQHSVQAIVALSADEKAELRAVRLAGGRRRIAAVSAPGAHNAKVTLAATRAERLAELRRRVSDEALMAYRWVRRSRASPRC
jgi:hypothetical protein